LLGRDPDKEWEKFGRKDPYYGVMTCDKFRKKNLDEKHLTEFFQSGRDHVEYILDTIRASVHPGFSPSRVLDFGCGVGRCAIPLAGVCPVVVGVDVSDATLEEARNNCTKQSLTNLEFYTSDDDLSNVPGKYDLIHSTFTIQHIPRRRGEKIFKRLVELLSDDGVAVVDFLIHRDISPIVKTIGLLREKVPLFNNIANIFYGKPFFEPLMEKNVYDLNRIIRFLHESGCGNLHIRPFRNGNHLDAILFFRKRRDRTVPHELFFNEAHP
jgi:2-polyprenyl-3-methyl-5-hydroxy-6-metoxy-1,4-benzoquinol methylase